MKCVTAFQHRTQILFITGSLSSVYLDDPPLVYSTGAGAEAVRGVTCLGDEVFVLREGHAEVEVYDVILSPKRRFTVAGLANPWDVASCAKNQCLYILERQGQRVYREEFNGNARNWNLKALPESLSVTPKSNAIVTMCFAFLLNEFTPDGHLVREVNLKQDVANPLHAVQLTSGQLLVSHLVSQQRVCTISDDARVVLSFGGQQGAGAGQLNYPYHLSVDGQGFILVADTNNNRIVLLHSTLTRIKELVSANSKLNGPLRLFLNESLGLLYVGEYLGRQVSVFRVKNFQTI